MCLLSARFMSERAYLFADTELDMSIFAHGCVSLHHIYSYQHTAYAMVGCDLNKCLPRPDLFTRAVPRTSPIAHNS